MFILSLHGRHCACAEGMEERMSEEKKLQEQPMNDQATAQENPDAAVRNGEMQGSSVQSAGLQQQAPGGKKMKRGMQVAIAVVALLLIGVAGFAAGRIYKAVQKANMDPTEYYKYVVKKTRDTGLKNMTGYYDMSRKATSGERANREIDMSVEISDTAKSMLSLAGLDVSGMKNVGLNLVYGSKGDDTLANLALKVNGEDLLTGKASANIKDKKAYVQVPELSKAYLDISGLLGDQETNEALAALKNQKDFLPEVKDLEEFILRYSDIFIKNAKGVEKKNEVAVKVEDISEKATTYTFAMKNDKVVKLLQEYVKELEKDPMMKKMLAAMDEEAYAAYVEEMQEAGDQLSGAFTEEAVGEIKVTVEAQISSDDRIVGQRFVLENAGQQLGSLSINFPKDGNKFGGELVLQAQGKDLFKFVGSGTNDSGVLNGEFKLGMDSSLLEGGNLVNTDELLVIKLEDYDCSKLLEGKVQGSYTLSTSALAELANCSLVLEQKGSVEDMKQSIKVMLGKDVLVTVDATSKGNAKLPEVLPSESDKVYDASNDKDIVAYQNELDIPGLLQNVQKKTGIDMTGLLLQNLGDEGLTDPGDAMVD